MPRPKKIVANEEVVEPAIEATIFNVYKNDNIVRVYNLSDHGDNAESLAKEYAGKIGGTVK